MKYILYFLIVFSFVANAQEYESLFFDEKMNECKNSISKYNDCATKYEIGSHKSCLDKIDGEVKRNCVTNGPYVQEKKRLVQSVNSVVSEKLETDPEVSLINNNASIIERSGKELLKLSDQNSFNQVDMMNFLDKFKVHYGKQTGMQSCINDLVKSTNSMSNPHDLARRLYVTRKFVDQDKHKSLTLKMEIDRLKRNVNNINREYYSTLAKVGTLYGDADGFGIQGWEEILFKIEVYLKEREADYSEPIDTIVEYIARKKSLDTSKFGF